MPFNKKRRIFTYKIFETILRENEMRTPDLDFETPKKLFYVDEDQIQVRFADGTERSSFTNDIPMYKIINEKYSDYWNRDPKHSYIPVDSEYLAEDFDTAKKILLKVLNTRLDNRIKNLNAKINLASLLQYNESTTKYKLKPVAK